ncbi:hypothetical protein [Flavobacterium ginsenosidimutans]|uniref:hypothetical protein n=1 Tax=Flavobacterium ginsenosidimutans TaxID=687844 RepID=UPI000DABB840|nr:hypothetical protein [Flavobacterium ginsenosidimutans]KAF2328821.1 hypothetical protein DM444_17285 [Flavobacterium ginsenosidimutans]
MKKIQFVLALLFIISSCQKKSDYSKLTYNQKANELIQQVLINESCNCVMEISDMTMIKTSMAENPRFDIRKEIVKKLHLRNKEQLDTLENISKSFILDTVFLKHKNIKIIKRDSITISNIIKDHSRELIKKCPNGVLSFTKPILHEEGRIALVDAKVAFFSCLSSPLKIYIYRNEKWVCDKN